MSNGNELALSSAPFGLQLSRDGVVDKILQVVLRMIEEPPIILGEVLGIQTAGWVLCWFVVVCGFEALLSGCKQTTGVGTRLPIRHITLRVLHYVKPSTWLVIWLELLALRAGPGPGKGYFQLVLGCVAGTWK